MQKILGVILTVISTIVMFGGFIYLIYTQQRNDFNEFKNEIETLIEYNNVTEYQENKIFYKMYEYARSDFSTVESFKVYTLNGFERYLKQYDYDFWYEIKIIFEE